MGDCKYGKRFYKPARAAVIPSLKWLLPIIVAISAYAGEAFGPTFLQRLAADYGEAAYQRGVSLQALLHQLKWRPIEEQLAEINRYFNHIPYAEDSDHWGAQDYWATPEEFLGTNQGDCEDYVIAKYVALRAVGVPEGKLFLTYVKAKQLKVAHMVLTYFPNPNEPPLVLDNYNPKILPATQRTDLLPVYSFNADSFFLTAKTGAIAKRLPPGKIKNSKWDALKHSLDEEQRL